jgi:hypothetical protein
VQVQPVQVQPVQLARARLAARAVQLARLWLGEWRGGRMGDVKRRPAGGAG